jgi:hypothetical protein
MEMSKYCNSSARHSFFSLLLTPPLCCQLVPQASTSKPTL